MKSTKVKVMPMQKNAEIPEDGSAARRLKKLEAGAMRQKNYSKITDAAAKSDLYIRNEPIPFGAELFPQSWRHRFADLYYPNAAGGGIYIDTPMAPYDVTLCEEKHKAYFEKGVRYTYFKANEGEIELLERLPPKEH